MYIVIGHIDIGLVHKLQPILPHRNLFFIYWPFTSPHLDNGDDVYDQPCNASFSNIIESVQDNTIWA